MVPELRTCSVSYKDMEGVTHTVEITASSLYEAAVLEMKAFEQSRWGRPPGGLHGDHGEVSGRQASSTVTNWLRSSGSPREVALKSRLKEILGWSD